MPMPTFDGPLKFLQCMVENAYKFKLPGDYDVSATSSFYHSPFNEEKSKQDLRESLLQLARGKDKCFPTRRA